VHSQIIKTTIKPQSPSSLSSHCLRMILCRNGVIAQLSPSVVCYRRSTRKRLKVRRIIRRRCIITRLYLRSLGLDNVAGGSARSALGTPCAACFQASARVIHVLAEANPWLWWMSWYITHSLGRGRMDLLATILPQPEIHSTTKEVSGSLPTLQVLKNIVSDSCDEWESHDLAAWC
jgi:hypothetical protein